MGEANKRRTVLKDNSWIKNYSEEEDPNNSDLNFGKTVLGRSVDQANSKSAEKEMLPFNSGSSINSLTKRYGSQELLSGSSDNPLSGPQSPSKTLPQASNPSVKMSPGLTSFTARVYSGSNSSYRPISPGIPSPPKKPLEATKSQMGTDDGFQMNTSTGLSAGSPGSPTRSPGSTAASLRTSATVSPKLLGPGDESPRFLGLGVGSPRSLGPRDGSPRSPGPEAGSHWSLGPGAGSPKSPGLGGESPRSPGLGGGSPRSPGLGAGSPRSPGLGAGSPRSPGLGAGSPRSPGLGAGSPRSPGQGAGSPRSPGQGAGSPRSPGQGAGSPRSPGLLAGSPGQGAGSPRSPGLAAGSPRSPGLAAGSPRSPGLAAGSPGLGPELAAGSPRSPGLAAGSPRSPGLAAGSPRSPGLAAGSPGLGAGSPRLAAGSPRSPEQASTSPRSAEFPTASFSMSGNLSPSVIVSSLFFSGSSERATITSSNPESWSAVGKISHNTSHSPQPVDGDTNGYSPGSPGSQIVFTYSQISPTSLRSSSYRTFSNVTDCTVCRKPIDGAPKMILEELQIFCHASCFKCAVCHRDLGYLEGGQSLWVHQGQVNCFTCYRKAKGQWYT